MCYNGDMSRTPAGRVEADMDDVADMVEAMHQGALVRARLDAGGVDHEIVIPGVCRLCNDRPVTPLTDGICGACRGLDR